MSLRRRLLLSLLPLLALLVLLGGGGLVLLNGLAGRIDLILRENYDSVLYMERLGEALERMDSALQFAMLGREQEGRKQFDDNRRLFDFYLDKEERNITLPGEGDLARRLRELGQQHERQARQFFTIADEQQRRQHYFGAAGGPGLLTTFKELKTVSGRILRLNQDHMEQASREARATAGWSLMLLGGGLVLAGILGVWLTLRTVRALLTPVQDLTQSALAIGRGELDQVVPVVSGDELGQLAEAFNAMSRELRGYRQSQEARLGRLQQASQSLLSAFPYPVLIVDQQGRIVQANPAARRILGVGGESQEPLAWQPPEPLRQHLEAALREHHDYLPDGFGATFVLELGGTEYWFLPRIFTIASPQQQVLGAAVVLLDVTRFRLLDQVKSNLVATVSHELKTPLTSIQLVIHLLLEESVGPLSAKQLELLLDARDNTERLLAMINNLLDLARLEGRGRVPERRRESPATLLEGVVERLRPRAASKEVQLVLDIAPNLPAVLADPQQLGHALDNLLDNALRYTPAGGTIAVRGAVSDNTVSLIVSDTGAGIPEEYLPHVFERFFRVPGQGEESGTGLGLAIVREIAAAHGGDVQCQSRLGAGTTFTITLPLSTPLAPYSGRGVGGEGLSSYPDETSACS